MDINGNIKKQRNFVVGDIHGHNHALVSLLDEVKFDYENDRLISLGDLGDRGPETWEVLETLLKVKNVVLIRGNHDEWLEDFLTNKKVLDWWMNNGFKPTAESYLKNNFNNIDEHLKLLKRQVPYYIADNIIFIHGGFDRSKTVEEQMAQTFAWDRDLVTAMMSCKTGKLKTVENFSTIFIGHTPTLYWNESIPGKGIQPIYLPINRGGVWNLDTGCGKGGPLTLFNLDDKTYIQTKDKYYSDES